MKRFHVHVAVADLPTSIRYYSALFASEPTIVKSDYAKGALEDSRVNFAISSLFAAPTKLGVDHLGIQVETASELVEMQARLENASLPIEEQNNTTCCYAKSDKYWSIDPQGAAWESFHTLDGAPTYGHSRQVTNAGAACCSPAPAGFVAPPKTDKPCCEPRASCC